MMYSILVSHREIVIPDSFGLSKIDQVFSRFRLTLLFNFSDQPSIKNSLETIAYTSSPVDRIAIISSSPRRTPAQEFNLDFLEPLMLESFTDLSILVQKRVNQESSLFQPLRIPQFKRFAENWSRSLSVKEAIYGEAPIFGHKNNMAGQRISSTPMDKLFYNGNPTPFTIIIKDETID